MNEYESSREVTNQLDSVLTEAAQNERIKLIVEWMLTNDLKNFEKVNVFYEYMALILSENYDIYDESLRQRVYEKCEVGILESHLALSMNGRA